MTFELLCRLHAIATALLLAALILDAVLRRRWVLGTASLWNALLLAILALPATALIAPRWQIPVLPVAAPVTPIADAGPQLAAPEVADVEKAIEPAPADIDPIQPLPAANPAPAPPQVIAPAVPEIAEPGLVADAPDWFFVWLARIYWAGICLTLVRLFSSWRVVNRLRKNAVAVGEGLWQSRFAHWRQMAAPSTSIRLLQIADIQVPVALGLRDRVIVIPSPLIGVSSQKKIDAILIHELAHIARADYGWQLLQRVIEAVLWYHPLMWLSRKRIAFIRERACDDFVIHAMGDNLAYSETLLDIVARMKPQRGLALGLAVVRSGNLARRLEAIARSKGAGQFTARPVVRFSLLVIGLLCVSILGMVGYRHARGQEATVTAEEVFTLRGHTEAVRSVAFSPDGKFIASASQDKTVKLWEAATGKELFSIDAHANASGVRAVAFSPNGKLLATAGDTTPKLWNVVSGKQDIAIRGRHIGLLESVAFSPDGKQLASASGDETVKLWDVATGQETLSLKGHSAPLLSVAFSPDGKFLASADLGGSVIVWDRDTGREVYSFKGLNPKSAIFSPDGKFLVAGDFDNNLLHRVIRFWDTGTWQEARVLKLQGRESTIDSLAFSPDGKVIAIGGFFVKLLNVVTGEELAGLKGHTNGISSVAFSPDGKRLASASYDNTVKVWALTSSLIAGLPPARTNSEVDERFTKELPGGVTVEFVGMSEYPENGSKWWGADGVEIASIANWNGIQSDLPKDKKGLFRRLYFRVEGASDADMVARWEIDPVLDELAGGGVIPHGGGAPVRAQFTKIALFPEDVKTAKIKFGVAYGPWKKRSEVLPDAFLGTSTKNGSLIVSPPLNRPDGALVVNFSQNAFDEPLRLVAVDKDGNEHPPDSTMANDTGNKKTGTIRLSTVIFNKMPLESVKVIRLQARQYQWVEFNDVQLWPSEKKESKAEKLESKSVSTKYYMAATRFRQNPDGTFPTASLANIRKAVEAYLAAKPGWPDAVAARTWLEVADKKQTWTEAELIAMLDQADSWDGHNGFSLSRASIAEMNADMDLIRPGTVPTKAFLAKLSFGPSADNGLRAAYLLEPQKKTYTLREVIKSHVIFLNDGKKPIQLATDRWRQDDRVKVRDANGNDIAASGGMYTGWRTYHRFLLKPGEIAQAESRNFAIGEGDYEEEHGIGAVHMIISGKPGDTLRLTWSLKVPSLWTRGIGKNQTFPAPGDWVGDLETGVVSFKVVAPNPNAKPPVAVAMRSGNYRITDKIRLEVSDRTAEKHTNEAAIAWRKTQGIDAAGDTKYPIPLPDGYSSYAIVFQRGGTMLWILDLESLRAINFADPQNVVEVRSPRDRMEGLQEMPAEVRKELQKLFGIVHP